MKLADISLKKNVKYNDTLHPKVWDGEKLKPEIRRKLIEIAERYVDFLEIDASTVEDYHVVGSVANYNWNQYSDIDLHILIDFEKAGDSCNGELVEEFMMTKRALWLERFDIEIDGIPVEVGPQDIKVELTSAAVYSVLENKWLKKPVHEEPKLDEKAYDAKVKEWIAQIDKLLASNPSSADLDKLRDKVKGMRRTTLSSKAGNEFSTNNLVYKALRNQGYIEKIEDLRTQKTEEELSL